MKDIGLILLGAATLLFAFLYDGERKQNADLNAEVTRVTTENQSLVDDVLAQEDTISIREARILELEETVDAKTAETANYRNLYNKRPYRIKTIYTIDSSLVASNDSLKMLIADNEEVINTLQKTIGKYEIAVDSLLWEMSLPRVAKFDTPRLGMKAAIRLDGSYTLDSYIKDRLLVNITKKFRLFRKPIYTLDVNSTSPYISTAKVAVKGMTGTLDLEYKVEKTN